MGSVASETQKWEIGVQARAQIHAKSRTAGNFRGRLADAVRSHSFAAVPSRTYVRVYDWTEQQMKSKVAPGSKSRIIERRIQPRSKFREDLHCDLCLHQKGGCQVATVARRC